VNRREEAAGRPENRPNPGREGRDLREKKTASNCVACCKDKKRQVPPKTRWKEEQKEKARSQEAQGKENWTVAIPGPGKTTAAPGTEGSKTQHALREAQKGAEDPKKEDAQAPVACLTGVPRGTISVGELAGVTPSGNGGRTPQETLHEINQQYLRSRYKFKEGAPLKEYLRQRVPNIGETCSLLEVLTWLKEIIRDNLLFDENNPSMIVGDAPLEAALRKKRVHVNEIRGVVPQQLMMVEARQGPLSTGLLAGSIMFQGRVPGVPRSEARATMTPASTPNVRVVSLTEVEAGPVVLYSPTPGDSQVIGTVSYIPPPRPAAGQNAGGHVSRSKLHRGAGASIKHHARCRKGAQTQQGGSGEH
jgi:hypothetical protein